MGSNSTRRLLTKSRYYMALGCPTKLYYSGKPNDYADAAVADPFLKALSRGSFQVGALARVYYPEGIEITESDDDKAAEATGLLLASAPNVTVFGATFRHGHLVARVSIFRKVGKRAELIEARSKSIDASVTSSLVKDDAVLSDFRKHVYDIAFQSHVVRLARPDLTTTASLLLVNKSARAAVDGLNQLFVLHDDAKGRPNVSVKNGLNCKDLGSDVLAKIAVDDAVELIFAGKNKERDSGDRVGGLGFADEIDHLAQAFHNDARIPAVTGAHCRDCQFRQPSSETIKSGFEECWRETKQVAEADLGKPFVFDLWNFRKAKALLDAGTVLLRDLKKEDINPVAKKGEPGLTLSQRHWLQIEKTRSGDVEPFLDVVGLAAAMDTWTYPLHFIDFETVRVAIPFSKGRRPYEQIVFQFSHHVVRKDGRVEHANQYLNDRRGEFPNFEFVRVLKAALTSDGGTIFRYSHYENTVLCDIHEQLALSAEADRDELMAWIETITTSGKSRSKAWTGSRSMVDMWDLVKRYYFHSMTQGSTGIKQIMTAVVASSKELQTRYAQPIYGAQGGVPSLNFKDHAWIKFDETGGVVDPYTMLGPICRSMDGNTLDRLFSDDELADGGAAMVAYAMTQFTEMKESERSAIRSALLRYCELDTFAMVLVFEYWNAAVKDRRKSQKTA